MNFIELSDHQLRQEFLRINTEFISIIGKYYHPWEACGYLEITEQLKAITQEVRRRREG